MPVSVKRLPNEPILVAMLTGNLTVDEIKDIYHQSNTLITPDDGHIYRIADVREATSTFTEVVKMIQKVNQEMPGSTTDDKVSVTFVGDSTWVRFVRDAMARQGIKIAAFTTMESALESIRLQIKQDKSD